MPSQKFINDNLSRKSVISWLLLPFSILYIILIFFRRFVYLLFDSLSFYSTIRVISVGNIIAGGSGKTPFTLFLAQYLLGKGYNIAIVLRGYKGKFEHDNVQVDGENCYAAGDEATIYYQNLPNIPVFVGKNRSNSIRIIEEKYPSTDYILMDDAFQHLQVHQDLKFCLIGSVRPFGNGFCLPSGLLREPKFMLRNANCIVLNTPNQTVSNYRKPVIFTEYKIFKILNNFNKEFKFEDLQNKKNILLSGIGNPKSFEHLLHKANVPFTEHIILPDHFDYTSDFFSKLKTETDCYDYILTTEKDYAKIIRFNHELNLLVVFISLDILDNLDVLDSFFQ
jgi:tetraacyldisaccharide 4'-kinase